jgi:hypothetical protein
MIAHHPHGRGSRRTTVTGRRVLLTVALGALAGSASFWWAVERTLTPSAGVAAAYTIILTLAPPTLMAFLLHARGRHCSPAAGMEPPTACRSISSS